MNPFFFGASDKALFGAYHPPKVAPARNTGVILCNPFGDEAIKAQRALLRLAQMLSAQRLHVLRFDYYGTGDSMGDGSEGTLPQWHADVAAAADELKDIAGINKVSFVGLRLGATLALQAVHARRDVATVVLWDPVVMGADYLRDLSHHHEAYVGAEFGEYGPSRQASGMTADEVMGFALPPPLRAAIAALDLSSLVVKRLKRLTLVNSTKSAAYARLAANLRAQQLEVTQRYVPVGVNWNADEAMASSLVPTEALQAIVAALT